MAALRAAGQTLRDLSPPPARPPHLLAGAEGKDGGLAAGRTEPPDRRPAVAACGCGDTSTQPLPWGMSDAR